MFVKIVQCCPPFRPSVAVFTWSPPQNNKKLLSGFLQSTLFYTIFYIVYYIQYSIVSKHYSQPSTSIYFWSIAFNNILFFCGPQMSCSLFPASVSYSWISDLRWHYGRDSTYTMSYIISTNQGWLRLKKVQLSWLEETC